MGAALLDIAFFQSLADEHRQWLAAFDPRYLRNWRKNLSADEESALAEARIRRILQCCHVIVEPNEDLIGTRQQPDFRCFAGDYQFYVEVTSISIETATVKAGIEIDGSRWTTSDSLNVAVVAKCKQKAKQCSNLDAPAVLAVATFNAKAAMASFNRPLATWLLTGQTMLAWNIDAGTGIEVGDAYEFTSLESAAFLRPDGSEEIEIARKSISGVVLCGLGSETPRLIGVLNPGAARPFDASVLSDISFGQVQIDTGSGELRVSWIGGNEQ
jgi:hypothetical protein